MLMADLLHSCTDEGIAAAAVASIGGPFARSIRAEAERRGLSVGALTASLVSGFARNASERDWRDLALAMAGSDVPVLTGLEAMANRALRHRDAAARPYPTRSAVPVGRPDAVAWPVALS
jgi:hypothetical protein